MTQPGTWETRRARAPLLLELEQCYTLKKRSRVVPGVEYYFDIKHQRK